MIVFILGPNGSGKSAYAEKLAARLSTGTLVYIATMIPYGEEGQARVEKHRKQRESMGFITVEEPSHVSGIPLLSDATMLLEDVSNLLGNALFDGNRDRNEDSVFSDIITMCARCRNAVIVSIDGLAVRPEYDEETHDYINALNRLNGRISDFSDVVIMMHDRTPVFVKGNANELD